MPLFVALSTSKTLVRLKSAVAIIAEFVTFVANVYHMPLFVASPFTACPYPFAANELAANDGSRSVFNTQFTKGSCFPCIYAFF
jgi:hypothetical protein